MRSSSKGVTTQVPELARPRKYRRFRHPSDSVSPDIQKHKEVECGSKEKNTKGIAQGTQPLSSATSTSLTFPNLLQHEQEAHPSTAHLSHDPGVSVQYHDHCNGQTMCKDLPWGKASGKFEAPTDCTQCACAVARSSPEPDALEASHHVSEGVLFTWEQHTVPKTPSTKQSMWIR